MYRGIHLEINEGWEELVKPLVDFVLDNGGTVFQVKEKYGGLRFYFDKPYDADEYAWNEFYDRVTEAENKSYTVCEVTGKHGKLRSKGGWLKTLCDEKAEEYGYTGEVKRR